MRHIFERYTQSSDWRGSGLGSAIATDLVEAHGGQISAQSEVGQGTTITLTLPAPQFLSSPISPWLLHIRFTIQRDTVAQ